MSSEKHNLKGTRYGRMEEEVQRMLNKKRPRENEASSSDARPSFQNKKKFISKKPKNDDDKTTSKSRSAPPSSSSSHKPTTVTTTVVASTSKPKSVVPIPVNVPAAAQGYANDRTVYVQGLPFTCTEGDVQGFFGEVGNVVSIRLPKWHDSGKLKGYGHVEFSTSDEAAKAIELSGSYIKDRFITVERPMVPRALAADETTLATKLTQKPPGCKTIFIRNLPYEVTEEQIREKFMVYGPIMKVRLALWNHTNNLKGFGYIDFKREDSADIAVKKSGDVKLQDRIISVDYESGAPKAGYKGDKLTAAKKEPFGKKK
jgi:nucleolin